MIVFLKKFLCHYSAASFYEIAQYIFGNLHIRKNPFYNHITISTSVIIYAQFKFLGQRLFFQPLIPPNIYTAVIKNIIFKRIGLIYKTGAFHKFFISAHIPQPLQIPRIKLTIGGFDFPRRYNSVFITILY